MRRYDGECHTGAWFDSARLVGGLDGALVEDVSFRCSMADFVVRDDEAVATVELVLRKVRVALGD